MVSYWFKIAKFSYPLSFRAIDWGDPYGIFGKAFQILKLESLGQRRWRFDDPSLHRFCLIHPCDRQTDRHTDRQTELRWLRRAIAVPAVARKIVEVVIIKSKKTQTVDGEVTCNRLSVVYYAMYNLLYFNVFSFEGGTFMKSWKHWDPCNTRTASPTPVTRWELSHHVMMTSNCEVTAMTSGGENPAESRDVTRSRDHQADVMAKRRRTVKLTIIGITLTADFFSKLVYISWIIRGINYCRHNSTADSAVRDPGCRYAVNVTTYRRHGQVLTVCRSAHH